MVLIFWTFYLLR